MHARGMRRGCRTVGGNLSRTVSEFVMKMCARIPLGARALARGVQRGFTLIELMVVLVIIGLLAWMGVYLLWMQQRVYRQHWIITLLKFSVLGALYFMMLITALISLVLTTWVNT